MRTAVEIKDTKMLVLSLCVSVSIVLLTVFVFHKRVKRPVLLQLTPMSWSPINIIWDSRQEQFPISDETGRAVHSDHEKSPCFSEVFSDLSSLSDAEPYIVSKEFDYFALAAPRWEEDDSEDAAVRCTRELVSPDCVLDACDTDILMTECPKGTVLPM